MVRKAMRLRDVLAATGWSRSTLYSKISEKKFPKGTKLDPDARVVVWWDDQVSQFQQKALEAA